MIFRILPDLFGKSSHRSFSRKISRKQAISLTQQSARMPWISTAKRYLSLWAKSSLLLESLTLAIIFSSEFFTLGIFLNALLLKMQSNVAAVGSHSFPGMTDPRCHVCWDCSGGCILMTWFPFKLGPDSLLYSYKAAMEKGLGRKENWALNKLKSPIS